MKTIADARNTNSDLFDMTIHNAVIKAANQIGFNAVVAALCGAKHVYSK